MKISYGWIVVGAGMVMSCVGIGTMFSLAVFLQPMSIETGWTRSGISATATLNFICMGISALACGALSDRLGTRPVVLGGAVLLGIGLIAASHATTLLQFQLLFGVIVGVAAGSQYTPMIAAVTAWFEQHRSLAVSLVSAGMAMASLTVAPIARWLITAYDWRTALAILGFGAWALLLPAGLLAVRPDRGPDIAASRSAAESTPPMTAWQAFRTPLFLTLAATHFACCVAHSGPIFHMVSYAMICGVPPMAAVTVYGVAGLSGLGGRIGLGLLADALGVRLVLASGLLVQALAAGTYLLVDRLGEFYALSVVFGIAYGGVMPLYAVLVREYFGARTMGTTFGAISLVASLGMATGPLLGGWLFDAFASYRWLYLTSLTMGLGAAVIAATLLPRPAAASPANAAA